MKHTNEILSNNTRNNFHESRCYNLIISAVKSVDAVDILEKEVELTPDSIRINIDFKGDRCGDNFFEPRPYEEDDDYPNFIGKGKIKKYLTPYFGKNCSINVYDHEKGYFTVSIYIKYERALQ